MNTLKLIIRSLVYYRRMHLWVVLGTILSTAILVGALITGDSIRHSLRQIVYDRLGDTEFSLISGDRFFRTEIAEKLSEKLQTTVVPLLKTKGIAISEGGKLRVNNIQVTGVDKRFGDISSIPGIYENISSDEAIINSRIASRLELKTGDEFLLRIENLDYIPRDIPMSLDSETGFAKRFKVKTIVSNKEFGSFSLRADQVTQNNVFISLGSLGREMGLENKSNALLVAERPGKPLSSNMVDKAFKEVWSLSDAGFKFNLVKNNGQIELCSERIFLDTPVVNNSLKMFENPLQVFTYFVNEISLKSKSTPYSFVSSLSDFDLNENEIIINEWLANDLNAKKGDPVKLTYYVLGQSRSLVEKFSEFRINSVVPISGIYSDRGLMPGFPGLSDAENCRDWDPGIPVDLDKIRDRDEDYWAEYKGTPKAFISLSAAQKMWQNRFGSLTAVRFKAENKEKLEEDLSNVINPASLGFYFRNVRDEGLRASSQSVDFGQLFLGLSFFIIIAALLLTGLLFAFNIEQRSEEFGLYSALGITKRQIKRIVFFEGLILVVIGSVLGSVCGIFYNQVVLIALRTVWGGIVGTSSIFIQIKFTTVLIGTISGILITLLTIRLVTGNLLKYPAAGLQKGIAKLEPVKRNKSKLSLVTGVLCLTGVIIILLLSNPGRGKEASAAFFSAGFLLLTAGIAFVNLLIKKSAIKVNSANISPVKIGIRSTIRKRYRSLTLTGILASALFIVFAVGANRTGSLKDVEKRESGTGGFALFGETAIPVLYDLNSEKGRSFYSLNEIDPDDVKFVSFRVKEGDDASCLNLNRVSTPRLIGVDPEELSKRNSFTFVNTSADLNPDKPWESFDEILLDDVIPGIADQSVIVWGLGKSIGDTLSYIDESGNPFKVKLVGGLVNSVFQGNIIVPERALIEKYPSLSGSNLFLVDAPFAEIENIAQKINWSLQDLGVDLTPTYDRLARFAEIENTYLSIFSILGTFGLILGSIGIGIIIWRSVYERQSELALLRAVGFKRKDIIKIILSEYSVLLFAGICIGMFAALTAALPALMTPGSNIPFGTLALLLIIVILNGIVWIYSSTHLAMKKDLLPALRNE